MILEEETFEAFGYYPRELTSGSRKPMIVACELCGKFRTNVKRNYRPLCRSCARKGNKFHLGCTNTKESKAKMSIAKKGKARPDLKGVNNSRWKGGKKVYWAKTKAKRRKLGYTLLMPLKKGEEGHHVTDEYVIGIPAKIHHNFNSNSRKKHCTRVLQWLKVNDKKKYKRVLCVLAKQLL